MTVRIGQAEFWKTGGFLQAAVLLSAAFPIMPFFARSASVILLLIVALLEFRKISKSEWRLFTVLFCLAYLGLVFSLIVTQNLDKGFNELGQLAPLILLPLAFFLLRDQLTSVLLKRFVVVFIASTFLLVFYQLVRIGLQWNQLFGPITESEVIAFNLDLLPSVPDFLVDRVTGHRLREFTIDITGTHPTYQAIWLVTSVYFLAKEPLLWLTKKWYYLILIILVFGWVYFIGSRMGQIAVVLVLFISLFTQISARRWRFIVFGVLIAGLWFMANHPRFKEIAEGFNPSITSDHIAHYNSSNVRLATWRCALETIENNPWSGTGVGDIQPSLDLCYKNNYDAPVFTWDQYNTHNQYLHFWATAGIIGLALFVLQLFALSRRLLKLQSKDGFAVFLIAILFMLTENILVRSDGIHFFATFTALYVYTKR